jgi:catechol 2,3-dioxygenase-like lactoylglutathione lyase family enzyme
MTVTGLDHVSIACGDLDRSLQFYTGLLGLPLMNRGEVDPETVAEITGSTDVKVLFADIDLGRGQVLELLQEVGGEQPAPGDGHFSLAVDDIEVMYERLTEAGVAAQGGITHINEPGHWFGTKAVYLTDPDGVTIELIERPR